MKKVTISMVLYGSLPYTRQCLEQLFRKTPEDLYELFLFNNNSPDDTMKWLDDNKKNFPKDAKIYNSKVNKNFAGGNNYIANHSDTEYILFLNNDTIPTDNWLEPLIKVLDENPQIAAVGSKLVHPWDNTIQHAGVIFNGLLPIHKFFGESAETPAANEFSLVAAVTGASFLTRRELFLKYGGFDDNYKNGWEDPDLCMKFYEDDYKVAYEPKSVLYHYEGISATRMLHDDENREYFFKVWGKKLQEYSPKLIEEGYMYAGRLSPNIN